MQRYFSKEKIGNYLKLSDNDLYHIRTVMRMNNSDKIEIVYNQELYLCELEENMGKIIKKEATNLINKLNITLVVPLLKEQKMDLILQKSTELGVDVIIPAIMERSIIKIDDRKVKQKIERWQKICKEASEQSKRLDIPKVADIHTFNDLKSIDGVKLICSTSEKTQNLKNIIKKCQNYDKIILVIGPEGGLSEKEEKYLKEVGFISISLGNRIMRVETVPLFLLSIFNYESMEW